MDATNNWFESRVVEDWSHAVREATHRFTDVRVEVIAALGSDNADVRSAAIATLNESDDESAHDLVVALANDSHTHVQEEVLEYIEQFPKESDAVILLDKLKAGKHLFLASYALRKLCEGDGPLILDEEYGNHAKSVSAWEGLLHARGLVA